MIGIYEYKNGLKIVAVSNSIEDAKKAIFDITCEAKQYYNYNSYWENVASQFYQLKEIEKW